MEKYIAPDRKRIPYGMMNFAVIRRDDCYYVDKTRFIPMIEEADKFFFFIRPRRFGKSLTVNMLQHYYDILAKDKFDALFGDLYIGKHPTRDRNSYLVLYLNFSGIVGELHNYRKGLDAHCQTMFDYFCDIYADYLPKGIKEELDNLLDIAGKVKDPTKKKELSNNLNTCSQNVIRPTNVFTSLLTNTTISPMPSSRI